MNKLLFCIILVVGLSYSNPVAICIRPVITEVQVTDSNHWNIEIVQGRVSNTFKPCSLSAFTLFTDNKLSDSAHAHPVKPIFMDTVGSSQWIGVITQSNFPNVFIKPGDIVTIKGDSCGQTQSVHFISIPPNQSLASISIPYISFMMGAGLNYGFCCKSMVGLVPCKTPTIGKPNYNETGTLEGHVKFSNGLPCSNISVVPNNSPGYVGTCYPDYRACSSYNQAITDDNGFFSLTCIIGSACYLLFFDSPFTKPISKISFPVKVVQDSTTSVDIVLDDYTSINTPSPSNKQAVSSGQNIRIVRISQASGKRGVTVMFNKTDETKEAIIFGFYSSDGELLHQSTLSTMGSGTYSGFWDTRDAKGKIIPAGSYICRIKSGNKSINQTFILMQ